MHMDGSSWTTLIKARRIRMGLERVLTRRCLSLAPGEVPHLVSTLEPLTGLTKQQLDGPGAIPLDAASETLRAQLRGLDSPLLVGVEIAKDIAWIGLDYPEHQTLDLWEVGGTRDAQLLREGSRAVLLFSLEFRQKLS